MARVESVKLVDDLDGGEAQETVSFALDGSHLLIDLSAGHAAELRAAFAPFVGAARRSEGGSGHRRGAAGVTSSSSVQDRAASAAVREWAVANGFQLSGRGRIPNSVVEAYTSSGGAPATSPSAAPAGGTSKQPRAAKAPAARPEMSAGIFREAGA